MQWMEWWCILLTVKHGNTLTVCILIFQLNQGTCILGYVQMNSTHSGHLLILILVGRLYSRFTTYHSYGNSCSFFTILMEQRLVKFLTNGLFFSKLLVWLTWNFVFVAIPINGNYDQIVYNLVILKSQSSDLLNPKPKSMPKFGQPEIPIWRSALTRTKIWKVAR